jgi:hypothetical protein
VGRSSTGSPSAGQAELGSLVELSERRSAAPLDGELDPASSSVPNGMTIVTEPGASGVSNFFKIQFIHSLITSNELVDSGVITNPYSSYFDPTEDIDLQLVKVYYYLPPTGYLSKDNAKIPVVAICDAGVQEINKVDNLRHESYRGDVYPHPPRRLKPAKLADFVDTMGTALGGTFVLAIALSEVLVGRGLKRDDYRLCYNTLMNLTLLPLIVCHSRNNFRGLHLCREEFIGDSTHDEFVGKHARNMMSKTSFARPNSYECRLVGKGDLEFFYIYSAKVIAYATHKFYNEKDSSILDLLDRAFSQKGDLGTSR